MITRLHAARMNMWKKVSKMRRAAFLSKQVNVQCVLTFDCAYKHEIISSFRDIYYNSSKSLVVVYNPHLPYYIETCSKSEAKGPTEQLVRGEPISSVQYLRSGDSKRYEQTNGVLAPPYRTTLKRNDEVCAGEMCVEDVRSQVPLNLRSINQSLA